MYKYSKNLEKNNCYETKKTKTVNNRDLEQIKNKRDTNKDYNAANNFTVLKQRKLNLSSN